MCPNVCATIVKLQSEKGYFDGTKTYLFQFIVLLFVIQLSITKGTLDNSTNIYKDFNDTNFANDTLGMINDSIITISFENSSNETGSNESIVDAATELESGLSVTEDSEDSSQSQAFENHLIFFTPDEDICNCDLTANACDINCCCDPDCDEEDQQVFSKCAYQVLTADDNYCYQKDIILRNNTVYKLVKDPKSKLFCIMHDNFKHHLRFRDMPILRSHQDLNSVLKYKYKNTYSWHSGAIEEVISGEMKAGNPVIVDLLEKNISDRWYLPSSCFSDMCSCHENILYLRDFKSSCSYTIDLQKDCEVSKIVSGEKFVNFCINSQSATNYPSNSMVNLILHSQAIQVNDSNNEYYAESTLSDLCVKETKIPKPKRKSNICENVVTNIHFLVEHDGINGISKVSAVLNSKSLDLGIKVITQTYSVHFIWTNISETEKRSGNPGYQVGLPILVAANATNPSSEDTLMEKSSLSIFNRNVNSVCSLDRQPIKFGKNLKCGCFIQNTFRNCKTLHSKVLDIFLGENKKDIFVGVFGNANISNSNDWIEVFYDGSSILENNNKCFISLNLKINIVYAAVGSVANPQYKIVGVGYEYMKPEFVDLSCSPTCSDILLTTSVSFFDVTLSAVYHYAKVPSIKANLPADFFYPFLYGQSNINVGHLHFVLLMLILLWNIL